MGLFDGKAKREAAENEVMRKLSMLPILDQVIDTILSDENEPWIRTCQSYYDRYDRKVVIGPDSFEVIWRELHGEPVEEKVLDSVAYSYTKSGYVPLHAFSYDDGKKEITTHEVCHLWACVIRERMIAKMPNSRFSTVTYDQGETVSFTYSVPGLFFKDWFSGGLN